MFIVLKCNFKNTFKLKGFGLIEVMVAATMLALGLLAVASIQSRSLQTTKEFSNKENAIRLINQISSFLRTLDISEFQILFNASPPPSDKCIRVTNPTNSTCSKAELFYSLRDSWKSNAANILPAGKLCFCVVTTTNSDPMIRIAVKWDSLSGESKIESVDHPFVSSTLTSSSNCPTGPTLCRFT